MKWRDLRNVPRDARQRYAFIGDATVKGVIAFFWIVALSVQFSTSEGIITADDTESEGAFSQFIDEVRSNSAAVISPFEDGIETETESSVATTSPSVLTLPSTTPTTLSRPILIETTPTPSTTASST